MPEAVKGNHKNENIDLTIPSAERIKMYLQQVGNPYLVKYNGGETKISFSGKEPVNVKLNKYFCDKLTKT